MTIIGTDADLPIGRRIAAARREHGLTQQRLADEAGYSLSYLTKVEVGSKDATPAFITAVARSRRGKRTSASLGAYQSGVLWYGSRRTATGGAEVRTVSVWVEASGRPRTITHPVSTCTPSGIGCQ